MIVGRPGGQPLHSIFHRLFMARLLARFSGALVGSPILRRMSSSLLSIVALRSIPIFSWPH